MADGGEAARGNRVQLDVPGFAQEFLRRSPAYRRDYDSVMASAQAPPIAQEEMARRWGLSFPGRSIPDCGGDAGALVAEPLPRCHPSRALPFPERSAHRSGALL